eukprot:scaffold139443_cov29-Tisochrysis_lutea.AAC.1
MYAFWKAASWAAVKVGTPGAATGLSPERRVEGASATRPEEAPLDLARDSPQAPWLPHARPLSQLAKQLAEASRLEGTGSHLWQALGQQGSAAEMV